MDLFIYLGLFVVSLFVLIKASDFFVDAAESIGLSLGISPFIIGVTIVAFGTSLPELAASIVAVLSGSSELVVANAVGSNITNIVLVLGVAAIVSGNIYLKHNIMDTDMPLLIGSAAFLYFVLADQVVTKVEAILFLLALIIFIVNSAMGERDETADRKPVELKQYLILVLAGVFIYFGATYTIVSIKELSILLNVNQEIIGLTAVALGTSLPEVAVSVSAARKGKAEIAVGNILGSNIFNTYCVMGIPALIGNLTIPDGIISFSLPFMIFVSILFAYMIQSKKISKWEGALLILMYVFFLMETLNMGFE